MPLKKQNTYIDMKNYNGLKCCIRANGIHVNFCRYINKIWRETTNDIVYEISREGFKKFYLQKS